MVGKTKTKYLERGTAAFKVPEIMIEKCMLQTTGIQDLKRIDIWAAVMTLFVLLNPDQRYPFEKDIKLLKANTGNVFVPSAEHLLKTMHNFEFIEILVDNEKVFSNEVQTKLSKELSSLAATAAMCEMCPNTEFFLVCILPQSY